MEGCGVTRKNLMAAVQRRCNAFRPLTFVLKDVMSRRRMGSVVFSRSSLRVKSTTSASAKVTGELGAPRRATTTRTRTSGETAKVITKQRHEVEAKPIITQLGLGLTATHNNNHDHHGRPYNTHKQNHNPVSI